MPEYTVSHGIRYPLDGDRIKSGDSTAKLAADMKDLAFTTDTAITTEGTRAEESAEAFTQGFIDIVTPVIPAIYPDDGTRIEVTTDAAGKVLEATRLDGTKYIPHVESDQVTYTTIDVLIMAGQSNSQYGWYDATLPTLRPVDPNLFVWYQGNNEFGVIPAEHPDDVPKGIARAMREDRPDRAVMVIPTAVGGSGFTGTSLSPAPAGYYTSSNGSGSWDRKLTSDPKNLALAMMEQVQAALAAVGGRVGNVRFAWIQGENDSAQMTQEQYAAAFDDLVGWVRSTLNRPDMPAVVGGMVPEYTAAYPTANMGVHRAHIDTPRRLLNTAYQPGPRNASEYLEGIHFSKPGRTLHGQGMEAAFTRAKLNVTGSKPLMPRNLTAVRDRDTVTLTWDAPECRATAYKLEISTDNGATWANVTLANGPLSLRHTMAAPAAPFTYYRLSTVNDVGVSDYTPLVVLTSGRVTIDNTVGRRAFTWDDNNARMQMIYGDTGWRDISALCEQAAFDLQYGGGVFLKRQGSTVWLDVLEATATGPGTDNDIDLTVLMSGFRPARSTFAPSFIGNSNGGRVLTTINGNVTIYNTPEGTKVNVSMRWDTSEPWPASLPGTAIGSITV